MDMCISLSKENIKHPFATCPVIILAVFFFIALIHETVILAAKLILHINKSQALE